MAAFSESDVTVGFSIPNRSHITNLYATPKVRTYPADICFKNSHNRNMARRGIPKGPINWYLREWMVVSGIKKQTEMMELTGWSKATMSQLYNNTQDFSPKILNDAAAALKAETWELLMLPERAMAIRQIQATATHAATLAHSNNTTLRTGTNDT